jgi:hypothetical protein
VTCSGFENYEIEMADFPCLADCWRTKKRAAPTQFDWEVQPQQQIVSLMRVMNYLL